MTKLKNPVVVNHYPHKDGWEEKRELADAQTRLTDVTENGKHGTLVWASDGKTFWKTGVEDGKLTHVKGPYTLPSGRIAPKASEPNLELVYGVAEAIELAHGEEVEVDWDEIQVIGPRGLETFDFENDPELIKGMEKIQERLNHRHRNPFLDAFTNEVSGLMNMPNRFHQGKKARLEELGKKIDAEGLESDYRPEKPGRPKIRPLKENPAEHQAGPEMNEPEQGEWYAGRAQQEVAEHESPAPEHSPEEPKVAAPATEANEKPGRPVMSSRDTAHDPSLTPESSDGSHFNW